MRVLPISVRPVSIQNGQNKRNSNQNFNGVTKRLSHHTFVDGKKDLAVLFERTKPKDTTVGQLPPFMFEAIPADKARPKKIKEILNVFNEVADELRPFRPWINLPDEERIKRRPNSVVPKLKKVFVDLGLIKEDAPFDLVYLGEGNYKKAYKIDGVKDPKTGEELAFKIFHPTKTEQGWSHEHEWHQYKTHGTFAELNTAMSWRKSEGQYTHRGKFYFGDVAHQHFVDKYITRGVEPPKRYVNEYDLGLKTVDEDRRGGNAHNFIEGYSIDPGGLRVVNRVKNESKVARYILKRVKQQPPEYRESEWYRILAMKNTGIDKRQKEAGLAICIKHLPNKEKYVEECLKFKNSFADMGIAYALKYLPEKSAKKYFEVLMKRKDPTTQTVLLNEIPLLSRERLDKAKVDDLDVPRGEIVTKTLSEYYHLAQKHVLPEVEEHLASYVHLLPQEEILPEAQKLVDKHTFDITDRLLHKVKWVKNEEFSYEDKRSILRFIEKGGLPEKEEAPNFLQKKFNAVRVALERSRLDDD